MNLCKVIGIPFSAVVEKYEQYIQWRTEMWFLRTIKEYIKLYLIRNVHIELLFKIMQTITKLNIQLTDRYNTFRIWVEALIIIYCGLFYNTIAILNPK